MSETLHRPTVLVLNRYWQAIHVKTPAEAFCMLSTGTASALDMHEDGSMIPVRWEAWLKLPVREGDRAAHTPRGAVRVPTVLVAANYTKVPLRRPRFCSKSIWERDGGICQYTGRKLTPAEGNIDHVLPRSRGGKTNWENCVLADSRVNTRKQTGFRMRSDFASARSR